MHGMRGSAVAFPTAFLTAFGRALKAQKGTSKESLYELGVGGGEGEYQGNTHHLLE
jgi:hypothetical protein